MNQPDRVIEARYLASRQLGPTFALAAIAIYSAVRWYFDRSNLWALIAIAEFTAFVCVGIVMMLRIHRSGWVLRLDQHGVTVRGADPVAWTDLSQVALGPIRPFPAFTTTRWTEILAFVPRAGVDLPGPPHYRGHPQRWGAGFRRRFYGTNLTMLPHAMSVSADEIVGAAREWGDLEVRRASRRRKWVGLLLFSLTWLLVGAIVVFAVSLF